MYILIPTEESHSEYLGVHVHVLAQTILKMLAMENEEHMN